MKNINSKNGIIKLFILVIVGVSLLVYFKIDIREIVQKPEIQQGIVYIEDKAKNIWDKYLKSNFETVIKYISDKKLIEKSKTLTSDISQRIVFAGKSLKDSISSK